MISIDTNVLVRVLIDDGSKDQILLARKLVKRHKQLFIAKVVQVELIWVLARSYELKKEQVLIVMEELIENEAFYLEDSVAFINAMSIFRSSNVDFSDCLILEASKQNKAAPLYTFDKKLTRVTGAESVR